MTLGVAGNYRVSVIIPAYNAAATLQMQLDALAEQTEAPAFEVLVIDNRSTDGTYKLAENEARRSRIPLRVRSASQYQGASYARNVGAANATSDLLMFCDADDVVGEYWVRNGLRTFDYCDYWSGSARLLDETAFDTASLGEVRKYFDNGCIFVPPKPQVNTYFPILSAGTFGITKSLFVKMGGFDQSFGSNGEDNDFAFRASRNGFPTFSTDCVTIGYRGRWEPSIRRRLARRSARSHALLVTRYEVRKMSPYPHTLIEALKIIAYPAISAAKLRTWDAEQYGYRIARWRGFAEGRLKYGLLRKIPPTQLGIGLDKEG